MKLNQYIDHTILKANAYRGQVCAMKPFEWSNPWTICSPVTHTLTDAASTM